MRQHRIIAVLACLLSWACIDLPEVEQVLETPDAGEPDAHVADSGTLPDASTPDSGTPDSGTSALTVTLVTSKSVTNSDVQVRGNVTGATPDEVELLVDGVAVATLAPPYELRWSAQSLDEGTHVLALRASLEGRRFTSESRTLVVDRTPPRLISQMPLTGAQFVSVHQEVQATFSEPLDSTTVSAESVRLLSDAGVIAAEVVLASEGTSLTIHSTSPLPADAVVQVGFEGTVVDLAGNAVQALPEPWTWTVPGFLPLGEPQSASPTVNSEVRCASLQVDGTGQPVLAWWDGTNVETPFGIRVRRWNGSDWEQLGGVLEVPPDAASSFCSLSFDEQGRPVVIWTEIPSSRVISVRTRRWSGATWEALDDVVLTQQALVDLFVAKGNKKGQIALAFAQDYQGAKQVLVWRWNGTSWGMLGPGLKVNSSWNISNVRLGIDAAGNPAVAWSETNSGDIAAYVRRWNGSAWDSIPAPAQTYPGQLIFDDSGAPVLEVLAWNGTARSAQLQRWNGSAWLPLGNPFSVYPGATDSGLAALVLDAQGRLTALVGEPEVAGGAAVLYVRRWNAGVWESVGSFLRKTPGSYILRGGLFAVGQSGRPVLAQIEQPESEPGKRRVHVYTPND